MVKHTDSVEAMTDENRP